MLRCRSPLRALLALVFVTSLLSPPSAQAETSVEKANRLVKEGVGAARAGEFERAVTLFEEAYGLDPEPIVLRYLGQAKERLEDWRAALVYWEQYAEKASDEAQRVEAQRQLAELRGKLPGRLTVSCAVAGAQVSVDGAPKGRTPLASPVELAPGEHVVKVVSAKHLPFERRVVVAANGVIDVPVVLMPLAIPAGGGQKGEAWYQKWWVWTAAGAVVAGSVTAAVLLTQGAGGSGAEGTWKIQTPLEMSR